MVSVLVLFLALDQINFRQRRKRVESDLTTWRCDGAHNFIFLFVLLGLLVAAPIGWRGPIMILTALGSYGATPRRIREANNFSFAPLKEIGWLFLGIFGTMLPILEYLEVSAEELGLRSQAGFYWSTGLLSALLDNAPTYLAFFAAALGLHGFEINDPSQVSRYLSQGGAELVAVSLGAAFFGALTYIGNAPNLLIKTIAEHSRVPTPTFVGYILRFAFPILIPIFALVAILFFRP